jgi:hypothetical protein
VATAGVGSGTDWLHACCAQSAGEKGNGRGDALLVVPDGVLITDVSVIHPAEACASAEAPQKDSDTETFGVDGADVGRSA